MTIFEYTIVIIKVLFVVITALTFVPLMIWLERKGAAIIQDRIGPNRASIGFLRLAGLVHIVADSIKIFFKEDITPKFVNKFYYYLAPWIAGFVPFLTFAVIPFADKLVIGDKEIGMQVLDLDIGLLWFFAIVSLSVYSIVFAGWSSNSKYSLLGGIRASAQMLSYEIPMGLSVISLLMVFGTANLNEIVKAQGNLLFGILPNWGIFLQPISALIFIVCAFAETNRTPFDLAEGESEIVGGFHTEYSSMKFGLFFMGEYISIVVSSALITTLFLGGWQVPYFNTQALIDNYKILIQCSLIVASLIFILIGYKLYDHYEYHKNRWKDSRDKEGLIFSILSFITSIFFIIILFVFSNIEHPYWLPSLFATIAQIGIFLLKVSFICWLFVWVRWTLPRFRYDQLMNLGWKGLLPLALANIFVTGSLMLFLE
ncbi:MAG: hypothetical protein KatS3mg068_0911 [Candidatus Sericytochromatia bacterium]|nr:MAG: hypothetical protein KatS3mg068_0911 [Candidatus Sericytochromatia bacterium]